MTIKMDRHKFSLGTRVEPLKVYVEGVAHCARSNKQDYFGATLDAIHKPIGKDPEKLGANRGTMLTGLLDSRGRGENGRKRSREMPIGSTVHKRRGSTC